MQWLGLIILLLLFGAFADSFLGHRASAGGYAVYRSEHSPTGYAVTRRYYDLETGDTYMATTPVYQVAAVRPARGTIHYGGYSHPPMGIQPRSY